MFPSINPFRTDTQKNINEQRTFIDLYVTTEWINDQTETHPFTSERCEPPTLFQPVEELIIGFHAID